MCFMLIGGRDSFESGMMLGGHNDDLNGYEAASLEIYPHMRHQPGASIQLPTGPVIPQPGETARCLLLKTFRIIPDGLHGSNQTILLQMGKGKQMFAYNGNQSLSVLCNQIFQRFPIMKL